MVVVLSLFVGNDFTAGIMVFGIGLVIVDKG